jgi:hypothetical protein
MKLGLTITSQHLPGEPLDRKLAETIEQVRLAREVGFDLITVPQHFLTTEFQMLQPSVIAEQDVSDVGEGRDQAVERVPRLLGPDAEVLELLDQELVETPLRLRLVDLLIGDRERAGQQGVPVDGVPPRRASRGMIADPSVDLPSYWSWPDSQPRRKQRTDQVCDGSARCCWIPNDDVRARPEWCARRSHGGR